MGCANISTELNRIFKSQDSFCWTYPGCKQNFLIFQGFQNALDDIKVNNEARLINVEEKIYNIEERTDSKIDTGIASLKSRILDDLKMQFQHSIRLEIKKRSVRTKPKEKIPPINAG